LGSEGNRSIAYQRADSLHEGVRSNFTMLILDRARATRPNLSLVARARSRGETREAIFCNGAAC
jgi:hypothetical protein